MDKTKKAFLTLFLVVATELIGFGLVIPILPQIAFRYHVSDFYLGIMLASYSFAQFFAAPILGKMSDIYGRRPILIISKLGSALSYVILAFSTNFWWFLLARSLDGLTGGNLAVARAYAADITTPENRSKGMAIIGISFGLGFVLGPALGGILYGVGQGHTVAALVAGALSFIAFLFTVFLLEEPERRSESRSALSKLSKISILKTVPLMMILCGVQLAYMIIFSGFETTFSIFTELVFKFTAQNNSLLFMYVGIMGLIIQGYLTRKTFKNYFTLVSIGLLLFCSGIGTFSVVSHIPYLFLGLTLTAFGAGLVNVFLPAWLSQHADPDSQGQIMGIFESIGSLSRILGPLLAFSGIIHPIPLLYKAYGLILFAVIILLSIYYMLGAKRQRA